MYLFTRFLLPVIFSIFLGSCGTGHHQDIYHQITKQAGLQADKKLLVVIFMNPECPITQKYTRTLNALNDSLKPTTSFVGVIPGRLFDDNNIAQFKKEFAFNLPIIKDEEYAITRTLGATIYPEVVLLNQQSDKLYSGKIDNWYESIGNSRTEPTEFYLKDAVLAYLQTGKVKLSRTAPVGCYINYKNN